MDRHGQRRAVLAAGPAAALRAAAAADVGPAGVHARDRRHALHGHEGQRRSSTTSCSRSTRRRSEARFALQGFDAPAYRFALDVDAVDADRYLPPKARDAEAGEATAGDIELPQNNTMNLDGTMQVGSLKLAGMQFADVGSRIVIGGGDLTLENARANLYGGTFAGNFRVRAAGDDPGLALDGRASGIALEPLIAALDRRASRTSAAPAASI